MTETVRTPLVDKPRCRSHPIRALSVLLVMVLLLVSVTPGVAHADQIEFPNGGHAQLATDGSITGTCQLVGGYVTINGYSVTVVMPDGSRVVGGCYESYSGVPDHARYPGPCDGSYAFRATKQGGGYFVYVYSQNAAAPAAGVVIPGPPAGYTYQHAYAERWTPNIMTSVAFAKNSSEPGLTNGVGAYALGGAKYDIYDADTDAKVGSITTDAAGKASCKLTHEKRYYAVETAAPKGYVLNPKRVSFTAGSATVGLSDTPMRVKVSLAKTDSATGGTAQPGASLAGAVFKLVDARGVAQSATTDAAGKASFAAIPLGQFSIVETKAPTGYKLDTTVHTYTVGADAQHQNGVVSVSYEKDFAEDVIAFDVELAKYKENPNDAEGGVRWPAEGVQFQIISKSTNKTVATLTTDAYGFARTPDNAWYGAGKRPAGVKGSLPFDSKGYLVREVASTVPDGYEQMADFTIGADQQSDGVRLKYIIENKTPAARLQIVKTDATTGQTVPLAGFTFRILDGNSKPISQNAWYPNHVRLDTFTTDESGGTTLPEQLVPGTYAIEEVRARPPYLLAGKPQPVKLGMEGGNVAVVRVADEQATGTASVRKTDTRTGEALAGAVFDVVACEDVIGADGTVQALEGEVLGSVETDAKGMGTIEDLPLGTGSATYAFVETQAPVGYVLDPAPHEFTLAYEDSRTAVIETRVDVRNDPCELVVHKTETGSGDPLEGVEFLLERVEENDEAGKDNASDEDAGGGREEAGPLVQDAEEANGDRDEAETIETDTEKTDGEEEPGDRETGAGADGLRCTTDEEGIARFTHLAAGTYRLRETKTLTGYVLDERVREVVANEQGTIWVDGEETDEVQIENDYTKVDISKRDRVDEHEVAGAHLVVRDEEGKVVERWVSAEEPHRIEKPAPGTYVLAEEVSPASHDMAEEVTFEVQAIGDVQAVAIYDTPIEVAGSIDLQQEIAQPLAESVVANGDGKNRASVRESDDGAFAYRLNWRNESNTWVDEFTTADTLRCCEEGLAQLVSVVTPVSLGDYDGKLNIWYLTDRTDGVPTDDATTSATASDGHVNPWLSGQETAHPLDEGGRALSYEGWRLWAADVPSDEATELLVSELDLQEGEHVVAVRFEYGRVNEGFTTRVDEWERDDLKDEHDDVEVAGAPRGHEGEPGATLSPAILNLRVTDAYTAESALANYAQVDLFRNGGGENLEAHDSDFVEQTARNAALPLLKMPQTGDSTAMCVAGITCAAVMTIVTAVMRRRRLRGTQPRKRDGRGLGNVPALRAESQPRERDRRKKNAFTESSAISRSSERDGRLKQTPRGAKTTRRRWGNGDDGRKAGRR